MSLMSVLALAFLFVAIVSLVVLEGREINRDHQQAVIVTIEPLLAPRKVRSLLRKHPWWSALIARFRQDCSLRKGPESYPGYLRGSVEHTGWAGGMLTRQDSVSLLATRSGRGSGCVTSTAAV